METEPAANPPTASLKLTLLLAALLCLGIEVIRQVIPAPPPNPKPSAQTAEIQER
jgi:hypothetical protein